MKTVDEIHDILKTVSYPDHEIQLRFDGLRPYIQVRGWEACTVTGEPAPPEGHGGRKWMVSPHMTKTEIVRTAFLAVQGYVLHEMVENFKYRGRPIFNGHMDVDTLWSGCEHLDSREPS